MGEECLSCHSTELLMWRGFYGAVSLCTEVTAVVFCLDGQARFCVHLARETSGEESEQQQGSRVAGRTV